MKISAQEEYGLRCLLRLCQSANESMTLPEIAAAEGLSVPYVAKLMTVLRQAGVIESTRGRAGGYKLAQLPEEIGLGSLLLILGEPLFEDPAYCERHAGQASAGTCVHHGDCSLKALWQTLENWIRASLDQITMADLIHHEGGVAELVKARLANAVIDDARVLIPLTIK
jgi:Rrf2 family protein